MLNQMLKTGFFRVEEIGTSSTEHSVFLKGEKSFVLHGRRKIVRRIDSLLGRYIPEITSLTEGTLVGEAEFIKNLYELAESGIKEMRITRKEMKAIGGSIDLPTSNLRFLDNESFRNVSPQAGLMHLLVSRTIGHDIALYCDENLDEVTEAYHDFLLKYESLKYKKIGDIQLRDKKVVSNIDEKDYKRLDFRMASMKGDVPDSIVYQEGPKKVVFPFPWYKPTIDKVMKAHGLVLGTVGDPNNPGWLADSTSLILYIIEKGNIEICSIHVDSSITGIESDNSLRCDPRGAIITLKRYGKEISTPATGEQAISLSYLYSKDVSVKDSSRAYRA